MPKIHIFGSITAAFNKPYKNLLLIVLIQNYNFKYNFFKSYFLLLTLKIIFYIICSEFSIPNNFSTLFPFISTIKYRNGYFLFHGVAFP